VPVHLDDFVILVIGYWAWGVDPLLGLFVPEGELLCISHCESWDDSLCLTQNWIGEPWVHRVTGIVEDFNSPLNVAGL
jgi:hypothetical protein